jgi:hypothetical protein
VPADDVGDDPAEQDADAPAARGDETEDAHRLGPLAGLREEVHHQRERDSRGDRAAETLNAAGDHEEALGRREAAGERREREQRDSDQEQTPIPVEIAEPPAEQQKAAVRQQVGVDDPGQRGVGEAEVVLDRGQGDADDRDVEDDHQAREAQDVEGEPAGSGVEVAHSVLSIWFQA